MPRKDGSGKYLSLIHILASQGAESIIAHLWVKKYLPVISSALHAHQAAWVEKISGDEFLRTYYEVPDGDPHSRPFCNFLNQLPPEILEGVSAVSYTHLRAFDLSSSSESRGNSAVNLFLSSSVANNSLKVPIC